MTEQDIATRRARDLECHHRRIAQRRAKGFCLKCGKRLPAPYHSQCELCAEKRPRRPSTPSPAHRRACRSGSLPEVREAAARAGTQHVRVVRIQPQPRQPGPRCEAPGGRDPAKGPGAGQGIRARAHAPREGEGRGQALRRPEGRDSPAHRARTQPQARQGPPRRRDVHELRQASPVEGDACSESCSEAKRAAEQTLYASRGGPTTEGGSRCAPCTVAEPARYPSKNAARREQYARRRAEGRRTACGAPSQGAARCEPRPRQSWERSVYFRAMPVHDLQFTVVHLESATSTAPTTPGSTSRWRWPSLGCLPTWSR